jgi:hypothetical protein
MYGIAALGAEGLMSLPPPVRVGRGLEAPSAFVAGRHGTLWIRSFPPNRVGVCPLRPRRIQSGL